MAEYRLYTLDGTRRIVSCHEVVCIDDRHAFIASTTLGDAGAEVEIEAATFRCACLALLFGK